MATAIKQDQLVRANVVLAQEMRRNIEEKDYDLEKVRKDAQVIYCNGLNIIRGEVVGKPLVTEGLTPVMVELNKTSGLSSIQHNLHVLIPLLKAHRVMTEITWMDCWRKGEQPTYTRDRDDIFRIAEDVKAVLPSTPKMELGFLISPAGAKYEVRCLEQAAKCLSPTDSIWGQFVEPLTSIGKAAIGGAVESKLEVGSLIKALLQVKKSVEKEWISEWYRDLFPLEWLATTITTVGGFKKDIEPCLESFTHKGSKYTLGLVKVLTIVFQNQDCTVELKKRVFEELVKLVTIKPDYSVKDALKHPEQVIKKLLRKPDRYAETRSFAAMALLEIASKPENKEFCPKIKTVMEEWYSKVKDKTSKKYFAEKKEAEARAEKFKTEISSLEKRMKELEFQLKEAVLGPARADAPIDEEAVVDEMDKNEARRADLKVVMEECSQEIALAKALEALETEESVFLDQLLLAMKGF